MGLSVPFSVPDALERGLGTLFQTPSFQIRSRLPSEFCSISRAMLIPYPFHTASTVPRGYRVLVLGEVIDFYSASQINPCDCSQRSLLGPYSCLFQTTWIKADRPDDVGLERPPFSINTYMTACFSKPGLAPHF